MSKGKLTERLFDIFAFFLGKTRSCFPMVAVITALFYGMISGSGIAVIAAVGGMVLPYLIDMGYSSVYFAAMLACAGALGQLIPPSSAILQWCAITGDDTASMFKCAMVIGFTCGAFLLVLTWIHCRNDMGDRKKINEMYEKLQAKGLGKVFSESIWALLCPVIILGGIFSNVLSVAEAASVSVIYAAVVALFIYKTLDLKGLWMAFVESVKGVAGVAMLLAFAASFGQLLNAFNGSEIISAAVSSVFTTPVAFITASIVIMTVAMFFMNPSAIVAPLLSPVLDVFGINRAAFGAGLSGLGAIGSLTPPFGMGLYVVAPIVDEDPMKICKTLLPIWGGLTIIIAIFMYFPQLCTWVL